MDAFEQLAKQLLEENKYWVKSSVKIFLIPEEKKAINKPTTPKPEIDLVAFDVVENILYLIEAKSFIDSHGVEYNEIINIDDDQKGRYKILTSKKYQEVIISRLKKDWIRDGFINAETKVSFGLIAGKVRKNKELDLEKYFEERNWLFWGPKILKEKIERLKNKSYENNPITITVKLLNPKN